MKAILALFHRGVSGGDRFGDLGPSQVDGLCYQQLVERIRQI